MNTMYVDKTVIVDVAYIVAAVALDGKFEDDGRYAISIVLRVSDNLVQLCPTYTTQAARDTALGEIGALVQAWESELAADEAAEEEDAG